MSRIDKLSIQGIRSFGSEESEKGTVKFFKPLTLILGPNGTGKTTIIECLKYATTGELPAGGRVNGAFINDPKIAGQTEVKAQVRLQFYDGSGARCLAQRSLTATQKKTNVQMKTLEGLIQKDDQRGGTIQISSRCAETDKEMILLLGVSKPILENVIFCHQEDSNWPLSEGKALKQKFDDIFASTRYVKALEIIRKCRQEKMTVIKEYKAELKYLSENKDRFEQVTTRIEELQSRKEACLEGMSQSNKQLKPLVAKLDALESQEENTRQISNTIAKLQGERGQVKKSMQSLKANIKKAFHGSLAELQLQMGAFKERKEAKEKELKEKEDKQMVLQENVREVQKERSKVDREQAMLQQDADRNTSRLEARDEQVKSLSNEYKLSGSKHVMQVVTSLQQMLDDMNHQVSSHKDEQTTELGRLQREMDEKRDERMRLETEKELKEKTLKMKGEEVVAMEERLQHMDQSMERLHLLKGEMTDLEEKLSGLEAACDVEGMRQVVRGMQKKRNQYDVTIRGLDDDLRVLHEDASTRTQLQVYNKERSSKEANIKKLLAKNEESLRHLMGEVPPQEVKRRLDDYIHTQSKRMKQAVAGVASLKNNLTQLTTTHKIEKERLEVKMKEAKGYEERLGEVTGGEDLAQGLNNLSDKMQSHQDTKGNLLAVNFMFKNYVSKLQRSNPDCPLCHRPFDEQSEVLELISELENKLQLVPEKLEKVQESIVETGKTIDSWIQLKPMRESLSLCKQQEIPKLEEKIKELSEKMRDLSEQLNKQDEELETASSDESVAKAMTSDATIVDKLWLDMLDLDNKISVHTKNLKNDSVDKTVEEVQKEKSLQMAKLDELVSELDGKQRAVEETSKKKHQCQERLHCLRSEKLKIEEELREKLQLEEGIKELRVNNQQLSRQIAKAKEDLQPVMKQIANLTDEKKQVNVAFEQRINKQNQKVVTLSNKLSQLKSLQGEIDKYEKDGMSGRLKKCAGRLEQLDGRLVEVEEERGRLSLVVDSLKTELAMHKEQERDLEDNHLLMEKEQEAAVMEEKIQQEKAKLGDCDMGNLQKEKNELKSQAEVHHRKLEALRIRKTHAEGEISSLKSELNSSALKDVVKNHKKMHVQVKTTEIACRDLEKYYKALDRAIMSYHSTKMSELNKIIKELWRSTYKGQDIELIEIRSDVDEEGASKVRRLYKYRVVMIRSGVEMDMRGRCSAGQKVLASLIIRLALAETFCVSCGMLALDEPTTNLDRENIESLAGALTEIIRARSRQHNFQLIVITHDEDFVELLGRSEFVDEFYKLHKDPITGNSKITRNCIQELQTK